MAHSYYFQDYYLSKCVVHRRLLVPLLDHVTSLTGSTKLIQILKTLNLMETDASNPLQVNTLFQSPQTSPYAQWIVYSMLITHL